MPSATAVSARPSPSSVHWRPGRQPLTPNATRRSPAGPGQDRVREGERDAAVPPCVARRIGSKTSAAQARSARGRRSARRATARAASGAPAPAAGGSGRVADGVVHVVDGVGDAREGRVGKLVEPERPQQVAGRPEHEAGGDRAPREALGACTVAARATTSAQGLGALDGGVDAVVEDPLQAPARAGDGVHAVGDDAEARRGCEGEARKEPCATAWVQDRRPGSAA